MDPPTGLYQFFFLLWSHLMKRIQAVSERVTRSQIWYLFEDRFLCSNEVRSSNPSSSYFGTMTPILPIMLVLSATTWCPLHSTKYPPDAARSFAKVWTFRLFLLANYLILLQMIWLCTGRPPGEFTDTAIALALETDSLESLLATLSVLHKTSVTTQVWLAHEHWWLGW